jgi:lipoyl(octanoyl) transferase
MSMWRFIDSGPAPAVQNMAVDEGLLREAVTSGALPVLRFYTWSPAAVSLGRFQDKERAVNAEACRQRGFDIVRRITGGRAVLHCDELTYSIIARSDSALFPNDILGTYKVIAAGLLAGLRELGIAAEMVSRSGRHAGMVKSGFFQEPACFSSPSWYEILVKGRKIIGSAQRRVGGAFLQHGSILIGYDSVLEAEVLPGGGMRDAVTCIRAEMGREAVLDEVKTAFREGFARTLGMKFQ